MKVMKLLIVIPFIAAFFMGCSKLNENMPAETALKVHEDGILTRSSSGFHGKLLSSAKWDYEAQCIRCHSADMQGGLTGKSCTRCHSATYLHLPGSIYNDQISDKNSPNYHAKLIAGSEKWNLSRCQKCHGANYAGLAGSATCLNCHSSAKGPEACNLCHGSDSTGAPPKALNSDTSLTYKGVGLHKLHLAGTANSPAVECAQCHVPVTSFSQAGHIDSDGKAEITWGAIAKQVSNLDSSVTNVWITYDPAIGAVKPNPVYSSSAGTCANVYCHGAFKNGNNATVSWVTTGLKCGSCHGDGNNNPLPKGALHRGKTNCSCHDGFTTTSTNKAKHIDGKLTIFGNDYAY